MRLLLQAVLLEAGYRVALAAHGREAVALAAGERPDLALVDLRMPVMDGQETLQRLKALAPDLPVLLMSAADDGETGQLLQGGAWACLTKPFDIFQLRDLVQQVLQEEV